MSQETLSLLDDPASGVSAACSGISMAWAMMSQEELALPDDPASGVSALSIGISVAWIKMLHDVGLAASASWLTVTGWSSIFETSNGSDDSTGGLDNRLVAKNLSSEMADGLRG